MAKTRHVLDVCRLSPVRGRGLDVQAPITEIVTDSGHLSLRGVGNV